MLNFSFELSVLTRCRHDHVPCMNAVISLFFNDVVKTRINKTKTKTKTLSFKTKNKTKTQCFKTKTKTLWPKTKTKTKTLVHDSS